MRNKLMWVLSLLAVGCALAGDEVAPSLREANKAAVDKAYRENLEKYKDNADWLVSPGVLADRKQKRVVVQTEAIRPNQPPEFFLVAENSGHDYEALAIALAKPSDIHKALVFIGMEPGRPCDTTKLQFWPKGERVVVTFTDEAATTNARRVRAEQVFKDDRTGKPLPERGFVFVGSQMVNSTDNPGTKVYAADARGPNSILSSYNEPLTVLDVPYQAPQGTEYEHLSMSADWNFPTNRLIQAVLEPEYKDGKKRVMDLLLHVGVKPGTADAGLKDLFFSLKSGDSELNSDFTLKGMLETVSGLVDKGHDPFVSLQFDTNLTVTVLHDFCVLLTSVDSEKGMRLEPPRPGHVYYKAFNPDPAFLDREKRIAQPWELRLTCQKSGDVTGVLTRIEQIWKDDQLRPDLKPTYYEVPTPEALKQALEQNGPGLPVILVIAQPAVTHGQMMAFLEPVLPIYSTIHVFVEK